MKIDPSTLADPRGLRGRLMSRRGAVLAVAQRHGAHNVRVIGSVARGDHTDDSDIDLLVDLSQGVGLFQMADLVHELEQLLESHVDVVSAGSLRPWDHHVLEEAVRLGCVVSQPPADATEALWRRRRPGRVTARHECRHMAPTTSTSSNPLSQRAAVHFLCGG